MWTHQRMNCFLKKKLDTYTQILSNQAVYNQHLKTLLVCLSFSYTLVCTYIFSPFSLFSEVARPLSKVCFAKGRVHFHIFPFDMRRLSIQSYVFLLPAPHHLPSLPLLILLRCSFPQSCPLLYTLLACLEGPGKRWHKQLLSNHQREKHLPLCVC